MCDGEALDVQLEGHWPHVGMEAEESVCAGAQPLAKVLGVGHGGAEGHDAHLAVDLRGDVAHARAHHLQNGLEGRKKMEGTKESFLIWLSLSLFPLFSLPHSLLQ